MFRIERTFAPASQSQHVSQVAFFTEYRHAFTATGLDVAVPPTVPAQDLIRQISDVIRGATAQTIPNLNGPGKAGYVIQGVTRKTSRGGKDGVGALKRVSYSFVSWSGVFGMCFSLLKDTLALVTSFCSLSLPRAADRTTHPNRFV